MKIQAILNIVFSSISVVLIVVILVMGLVINGKNNAIRTLQEERNHLSQTVKQLETEEIKKQEILEQAKIRLEKAEKVRSVEEAKKIWEEVWKGLAGGGPLP